MKMSGATASSFCLARLIGGRSTLYGITVWGMIAFEIIALGMIVFALVAVSKWTFVCGVQHIKEAVVVGGFQMSSLLRDMSIFGCENGCYNGLVSRSLRLQED